MKEGKYVIVSKLIHIVIFHESNVALAQDTCSSSSSSSTPHPALQGDCLTLLKAPNPKIRAAVDHKASNYNIHLESAVYSVVYHKTFLISMTEQSLIFTSGKVDHAMQN